MKKIVVLSLMFVLVLAGVSARDKTLSSTDLPQEAQDFLSTAFPEEEVQEVKRIVHSYNIEMDDNTIINFNKNGEWESITNRYGIPSEAIPEEISSSIASTYPLLDVVRIEKDFGKIEVTLSDGEELLFSMGGKALGKKDNS